jgi:crossover junction endodeoxyribonuclease RusA
MNLTLPFPPTGNHAVKHTRSGGHYATPEARRYKQTVKVLATQQGAILRLGGPVRVVAEINPPDRRRRDMDNTWKTCADALTHAGVWLDDFQITDLRLIRGQPITGGSVNLFVEAI